MRQSDFPRRHRPFAPVLLSLLLAACATETLPPPEQRDPSPAPEGGISAYLENVQDAENDMDRLLEAAEDALADGNTDIAGELTARLTQQIEESSWQDASPEHLRYLLLQASLQQADGEYRDALRTLNTFPAPRWQAASEPMYRRWLEQRIATLLDTEQRLAAVHDHIELGELLPAELRQTNRNRIWDILSRIPEGTISGSRSIDSYEMRGWLELLDMIRSRPDNIEDQISIIEQWRNRWNRHPAADALPDALAHLVDVWESRPTRLALLLPVQQAAGDAVIQGFMSAYYHALSQEQDVPTVRIYDTSSPRTTEALYRQAVEDGAELVIGPLDKEAVRDFQSRRAMPVPTLALNYTDNGRINPEGLYQFGLAPEDDIRQLTRAARLEGHRLAASLTPGGEEYRRIRQLFRQQWQELDGQVLSERTFTEAGGYPDLLRDMLAVDESETRFDRLAAILPRDDIAFTPRR
ncbi:MAG: penicillin-binding protein activator, partial [Pseudomonadota bacterium]